jgi:hypothetical protein
MVSEYSLFSRTEESTYKLYPILLVLSHMFGYLEQKLLGRFFLAVRNFKFQYDPFSNLKGFTKVHFQIICSLSKMTNFIFGYFSTKPGTSVDVEHEKMITCKFH